MIRNGFLGVAAVLCAPALLVGCKAESEGSAVSGGAVAASDFKPTKAQFIAPAPGKPAKMVITYARNLDPATQFSQLHVNYWSYDEATLPVYYGDVTIKCPDAKQPACSAKTFTVEATAGRLCRKADISKPGQVFTCGEAPSPKVQMHVVTNWIGVKPRDPHMQVDQLTPTL